MPPKERAPLLFCFIFFSAFISALIKVMATSLLKLKGWRAEYFSPILSTMQKVELILGCLH